MKKIESRRMYRLERGIALMPGGTTVIATGAASLGCGTRISASKWAVSTRARLEYDSGPELAV